MSPDTIISVEGVSKKFCRSLKRTMLYGVRDAARDVFSFSQPISNGLRPDEFWALDNVSFEVKRGECLGLIGPNGAGKSTLLKLLNGITLPDKGTIKTVGRICALLELGAGFHPMLTGRENIYLSGAILGLSKEEVAEKFDAIVDFAGLGEFLASPVKYYSSGMYVRLAFSIAAHAEPDVFLIDEAFAVGDISFQSKCFAKLQEFRERGITIILVTHGLDMVTFNCNRALLLNKGSAIREGTPKTVIDHYHKLIAMRASKAKETKVENCRLSSRAEVEWEGLFNVNPNEDRYGSRKAEVLEAGMFDCDNIPVQVIERNRELTIKIKVRHNDSMPGAIVAFSIKDPRGVILCGTNTFYQGIDMGRFESGRIILVVFRQIIRVNPGNYLLSVACGAWEMDEYVVYDRRFDYIPFQVVGTRQRIGLFDPESEVEWTPLD